ncbi:hypothetical protein HPB47_013985 [Ixodes persulcatus]|uniref:Uncharacterized protein n=1 Tax=Ixodes persulcatus TaxID=34615 RepID=A0AC60QXC2_IXOPE|nr:hypothetical protein HPB47_013985 [Ixodes persulcatus]
MLRQDTAMKTAITVEKRVAFSLYRLCSTAEERTIGHLFAVGQSVVNETNREFCDVVIEELEARTITMIRNKDLDNHMREFQAVLGFPNAIGALDGCHLPVSPPKDLAVDYHNYKGWTSQGPTMAAAKLQGSPPALGGAKTLDKKRRASLLRRLSSKRASAELQQLAGAGLAPSRCFQSLAESGSASPPSRASFKERSSSDSSH